MTDLTRRAFAAGGASLIAVPAGARQPEDAFVRLVEVRKGERKLHLLGSRGLLRSYEIRLGGAPVGPKRFKGDRRAPEGRYQISDRNPHSASSTAASGSTTVAPRQESRAATSSSMDSPMASAASCGTTGPEVASRCRTRRWTSCGASSRSAARSPSWHEDRRRTRASCPAWPAACWPAALRAYSGPCWAAPGTRMACGAVPSRSSALPCC